MSFALYGVAHQRPGGLSACLGPGRKGLGDESDKLVTIDADPKSKTYGKVVSSVSVGGRGEAHHMGLYRRPQISLAGRLDDSKIFIFDVGTDPAHPKLINTVTDLTEKTGYVGPHTFYAIPGRMVIGTLSNDKSRDGVTGLAVYNNKGEFLSAHPIPTDNAATAMATTSPSIRRRMCF